jgi:hypothetical protein
VHPAARPLDLLDAGPDRPGIRCPAGLPCPVTLATQATTTMTGVSYLLRVVLPDRPGSLGAVASALGSVGADISAVEVVEQRADGLVVDDFLLDVPPGRLPDALVSACRRVPGVEVEFVGRYTAGADLHRDLEAVEAMTMYPEQAARLLVDLVPGVFRLGWGLLVDVSGPVVDVLHASGAAPTTSGFAAPWLPLEKPVRLVFDPSEVPESWHDVIAVAAPLGTSGQAIVLGRDGGPEILDSELARLAHLVGLADAVSRSG